MRRAWKRAACLTGAALMMAAASLAASAGETGPGVKEVKAVRQSGIEIERLAAAQNADQVVVVVGSGMDSASVQVSYFEKEDGVWQERFSEAGYCGYNGMAVQKREGDRRTPTGTYSFTRNFGIKEDPGSILPYKTLDQHDYWVDDSNSKYYNQMVSTKEVSASWKSAEHLIAVNPCYNYSLALNYNQECVPGKGSAIFLHGLHPVKTWTEGCIAIPEDRVKELIQRADTETKIVIVPDASQLEYVES